MKNSPLQQRRKKGSQYEEHQAPMDVSFNSSSGFHMNTNNSYRELKVSPGPCKKGEAAYSLSAQQAKPRKRGTEPRQLFDYKSSQDRQTELYGGQAQPTANTILQPSVVPLTEILAASPSQFVSPSHCKSRSQFSIDY